MENFDLLALNWDNEPRRMERAKGVAECITRNVDLKPDMVGLEYGCGTGSLSFNLQPYLHEIYLADSSQGMLDVLKEKIEKSGFKNMFPVKMDLQVDEHLNGKYDIIYTLMTMHHILDVEKVIRKFSTLLKPQGYICIADLDKEDGTFHGPGFIGHNGFDRAEMERILEKCGFCSTKSETCFEVVKDMGEGLKRTYPAFLMTACRDAE